MKIKINAVSGDLYNDIFIEGELLQVVEDLRQGKIDISNIINTEFSWLVNEKTKEISLPKCFIIDYNQDDCDVEITIYDGYNE